MEISGGISRRIIQAKINSAAQHLNVRADQIVSLKFRENVGSYGDYRELVETLHHEAGVHFSEVDGDLQGHGYCLSTIRPNYFCSNTRPVLRFCTLLGLLHRFWG